MMRLSKIDGADILVPWESKLLPSRLLLAYS